MKYITDAAREYAKQKLAKDDSGHLYDINDFDTEKAINVLLDKSDAIVKIDDQQITNFLAIDHNNYAVKLHDDVYMIGNNNPTRSVDGFNKYNEMIRSGAITRLIDVQKNEYHAIDYLNDHVKTAAVQQVITPDKDLAIMDAAKMLFKLASLMNDYLDKSYKLAKEIETFMIENKIIYESDEIDFDSARVNFDDDILSIKSLEDADDYIEDIRIRNL